MRERQGEVGKGSLSSLSPSIPPSLPGPKRLKNSLNEATKNYIKRKQERGKMRKEERRGKDKIREKKEEKRGN